MNWLVNYTEKAQNDLRAVYEYIAYTLCAPTAAKRQVDPITDEIAGLDAMPLGFPRYKKEPWLSEGIRYMVVNNHVVFYLPDEQENTVTVIRIMYGGRDIENAL